VALATPEEALGRNLTRAEAACVAGFVGVTEATAAAWQITYLASVIVHAAVEKRLLRPRRH